MHHPAEYIAGFGIFLFDILLYSVNKRGIACFVSLHYFSWDLVDYYYVIVFVDYLHFAVSIGYGLFADGKVS